MTWGIRIEVCIKRTNLDLKQEYFESIVVWAVAINNRKDLWAYGFALLAVTRQQQLCHVHNSRAAMRCATVLAAWRLHHDTHSEAQP